MSHFSVHIEYKDWTVKSADKHFADIGPHECIVILRPGYVVASVWPRGDEDPELRSVGMRPLDENWVEFREAVRVASVLASLFPRTDRKDS